jgi:hypothetical protein
MKRVVLIVVVSRLVLAAFGMTHSEASDPL